MSAAVEHERSLLTAEKLRNQIVTTFEVAGKLFVARSASGGNS